MSDMGLNRPVFPIPFAEALKASVTLQRVRVPFVRDLNMKCIGRAYCGGFFRAAWFFFRAGVEHYAERGWFEVRWWVLKRRGFTDAQIERRWDIAAPTEAHAYVRHTDATDPHMLNIGRCVYCGEHKDHHAHGEVKP